MSRLASFALLCLLISPQVRGDARDSYRRGLEAIQKEQWSTAVENLRSAIGERPQASAGAFRQYLPHYYLGLALFEQGDCPGALAAWEEATRQGAVERGGEIGDIRAKRQVCARRAEVEKLERSARSAALSARLRDELQRAAAVVERFEQLDSQPESGSFWNQGDPARGDRLAEATRLLDNAREIAGDSPQGLSIDLLRRAESWAASARQRMEAILDEARDAGLLAEDRPLPVAEAQALLDSLAPLHPLPFGLAQNAAELTHLLELAEATSGTQGAIAGGELADRFDEALTRLRDAIAPPPAILLEAAASYLGGDYSTAVAVLTAIELADDRELAHARLLLAASRHALFLIGERRDEALLAQARADALACRNLDAELAPTGDLFGPRFVEFFEQATPRGLEE